MSYSFNENRAASQLAYDDWNLILDIMYEEYGLREFTVGEIYDYAIAHGNADVVQCTTDYFTAYPEQWELVEDWVPVMFWDDNREIGSSGYYAVVFETSPDSAMIAFRGSEGGSEQYYKDWLLADGGLLSSTQNQQQEQNNKFLKELEASGTLDGYSYIGLTGHSLGGNLAQDFAIKAARYGINIDDCAAFDAPGFSSLYLFVHYLEIISFKGHIVKYRASPVGFLLWNIPGIEIHDMQVMPNGEFSVGRGGELDNAFYPFARHDVKGWVTDEDGNPVFVEGGYNPFSIDSKSFLFIYSLSTFSKLLDCTPISFVIAFYIKELQYLNKNLPLLSAIKRDGDILKGDLAEADAAFSLEQMAQVEASLDNLRQAIEDATNLEGARAQADADLALAQMEQTKEALAAAIAYLSTVAEVIRRTIEGSPVMSVAESAASCGKTLFAMAWALDVSPENVWDLMPFIYSGLLSWRMEPPGNKAAASTSPGVISKIVSESVASSLASYKAQRKRDFSEDSRHVILDALDWMLIESPLDVTRHPNWPELEQECQRLAPDLLASFTGLSEADRDFNELVRSSRANVNRVFDEAQAVDADYAAGIRSDIEEISGYNNDIQELTSNLRQAAASMRRL